MWYFAWMLGLPLAAAFAVLNAMWFELMDDEATRKQLQDPSAGGASVFVCVKAAKAAFGLPLSLWKRF